jgi:hypothetical protein
MLLEPMYSKFKLNETEGLPQLLPLETDLQLTSGILQVRSIYQNISFKEDTVKITVFQKEALLLARSN